MTHHTDSLSTLSRYIDTITAATVSMCALLMIVMIANAVFTKPNKTNPMRCDALVDDLSYYAGPTWREVRKTPTGQWCVLVN